VAKTPPSWPASLVDAGAVGGVPVHPLVDADQRWLPAGGGDLGNAGAGRHGKAWAGQGHTGGQRRQLQAYWLLQRLHAAGVWAPAKGLHREPAPAGRQLP
jgi:hypothetical protein